ncbi:MAG: periplasmic heavy metal sensor [Bacteroidales bacterium]|nr:periplasmic heavy metal sensor [Bacteroidales bacterium]MCF8455367.1 periplasmic heavy metal sensor [Bacteroidales bacterium]
MKSKLFLVVAIMLIGAGISLGQKEKSEKEDAPCPMAEKHHFKGDKHLGPHIPDLTEAQEKQMQTLRLKFGQDVLPLKNEMKEKEARLISLKTAKDIDIAAINKQIEEIGQVKINLEKKHAALEQEMRKVLTDEQRLHFDMRMSQKDDFDGPEKRMEKRMDKKMEKRMEKRLHDREE